MDLKELGSRLRAERERQGFTIEQIMELTKVSRVNITAIESGNHKEFPHQVYAKGFIKNYAKNLGLDAEEIGEEFTKIITESPYDEDVLASERATHSEYSAPRKGGSLGTIVLVFVLAVLVGGLVYYLHDNSKTELGQNGQTGAASVEDVVKDTSVVAQSEKSEVKEDTAQKSQPALEVDKGGKVIETSIEEDKTAEVAEQNAKVAASDLETAPVAPALKNVVVITAKPGETCWLEAITDGNNKEYIVQEGESLSLPYKNNLKIKLGNSGGVKILSDGKPVEFSSSKGKVKNLEFPASS
ncbi:helix-turn-helix domain-containing protein [Maridesulfovibrio zosterae]|uniref:helix-turn-helix domain-containing protein n=1 Tax=Maridesulfovibrio zosterae TaxID=82171 RepID=UPI000408E4FD|nr:helix-turn-helix domain-containing protein [Maridesulfovibrio zosterae]